MSDRSVFVFSEELLNYRFSSHHPFNQIRLKLTLDLLRKMGAIDEEHIVAPRMATDEELHLVHDPNFVNAVKLAGQGKLKGESAEGYGLGTEDTPIFENMHEASALLVGGTLTAVDYVMTGKASHALNLGGGLHPGKSIRLLYLQRQFCSDKIPAKKIQCPRVICRYGCPPW